MLTVGILLLFVGQFLSLAWLAQNDKGCLNLAVTILVPVTLIALLQGLYAMFSVMRYFGMSCAAVGDHFDQSYRDCLWSKRASSDTLITECMFLLSCCFGLPQLVLIRSLPSSPQHLIMSTFGSIIIPRRNRTWTIYTGNG